MTILDPMKPRTAPTHGCKYSSSAMLPEIKVYNDLSPVFHAILRLEYLHNRANERKKEKKKKIKFTVMYSRMITAACKPQLTSMLRELNGGIQDKTFICSVLGFLVTKEAS